MYFAPYLDSPVFILYNASLVKPEKKIELKPMKKKVAFAEFVDIKDHKTLKIETNFTNKPSIKKTILISNKDNISRDSIKAALIAKGNPEVISRWKTDTIAIQLGKKGIPDVICEKKHPFYLNLSPVISLNGVCDTVETYLELLMKTKEEMYHVLQSFRKVLSEEKLVDPPSMDKIKEKLIQELKTTCEETLTLEDFKFLISHELMNKLSHLTLSKQYYSGYLAYLKKEWKSGEERTFICPLISPSLLVRYVSALEELFADKDFRSALERGFKEKTI